MLTAGLLIHKQLPPFSSPVMISQAVRPQLDDIWPGFGSKTAQLHLDLGDSGHGDSPAKVAQPTSVLPLRWLTGEENGPGLANLTSHQVQLMMHRTLAVPSLDWFTPIDHRENSIRLAPDLAAVSKLLLIYHTVQPLPLVDSA